jgi:tetratricopeptide (TPR) repeat protein
MRERLPVPLFVFGVALADRLLHISQIRRAPFFDLKLGDAAAYDSWARQIVSGDWLGHEVFYQAPLYPYVLALVYGVFGSSTLTVRLVQAVLSAASCALLADAGWRLFSKSTGLVAGLMLAFYPPAIFLDTLLQKSALDLLFLCLVLWLVSWLSEAGRRSEQRSIRLIWWQLGVAVACLTLTRENAGIVVVPILLWIAFQRSLGTRDRVVFGGLFFAGLTTVLAPVGVRNAIVGHEFFLTTSQFGPNLYIGNNERSDGTYKPLRPFREKAAFERQDAAEVAEQAAGRWLTPAEISSYYTRQVVTFIRTQPGRWVRLLGRKLVLTWNATEISDTEDQYTYARWSWPLRIGNVWHLGVLAPLAALGVWITAPDWRRLWVLYLMLAFYGATVVLFYVFARYRFPIVPFLMLFAAAALTELRAFLRQRPRSRLLGPAAAVGATALLCNLPLVPTNRLEAATHYNDGVVLEADGRDDEAIREYRTAIQFDPGLAVAHNDLGLLLGKQGRLAEAEDELGQCVRLTPGYAKAQNNLGVVLGQQGKVSEALPHVEEAVRLDPSYADARRNVAALLDREGRLEEAVREYGEVLRLTPRDVGPRVELSALLARMEQLDHAIAALKEALDLSPRDPRLRNRLANLLVRNGHLEDAVAELRRAIDVAPDEADLHNNLGIVLAQQGHLVAAADEFERALTLNPNDAQTRRNLERIRARR